jgi:hypothetical protein
VQGNCNFSQKNLALTWGPALNIEQLAGWQIFNRLQNHFPHKKYWILLHEHLDGFTVSLDLFCDFISPSDNLKALNGNL